MGTKPEYLTQIFAQGFTTKNEGHGVGLHSKALSAKSMGGSLTVQSAGEGQGATFTLGLPRKRKDEIVVRLSSLGSLVRKLNPLKWI